MLQYGTSTPLLIVGNDNMRYFSKHASDAQGSRGGVSLPEDERLFSAHKGVSGQRTLFSDSSNGKSTLARS
jgi:hypothetical protein